MTQNIRLIYFRLIRYSVRKIIDFFLFLFFFFVVVVVCFVFLGGGGGGMKNGMSPRPYDKNCYSFYSSPTLSQLNYTKILRFFQNMYCDMGVW